MCIIYFDHFPITYDQICLLTDHWLPDLLNPDRSLPNLSLAPTHPVPGLLLSNLLPDS